MPGAAHRPAPRGCYRAPARGVYTAEGASRVASFGSAALVPRKFRPRTIAWTMVPAMAQPIPGVRKTGEFTEPLFASNCFCCKSRIGLKDLSPWTKWGWPVV